MLALLNDTEPGFLEGPHSFSVRNAREYWALDCDFDLPDLGAF
jgi:hypothetical protein